MSASVFAFPNRQIGPQPWTNDELAELYRVVDMMARAGLTVATDMGMSDEGDPWFVFCRSDSGDVIAHFARISGQFVAASIAVDETYRGANFRQIVERIVQSQPLIVPPKDSGTRLLSHPTVILIAFIATALAHSEKLIALDSMRSVDAKWEHERNAVQSDSKDHKSLAESIQAIFKAPATDGHDSHDATSKESQQISLASLIAIAMSALQPVVEKISVISTAFADELMGHDHNANANAPRAAAVVPEMNAVDDKVLKAGESISVAAHSEQAAPQHKAISDSVGDVAKQNGDLSVTLVTASPTVKAVLTDDTAHASNPAPAIDLTQDSGSSFAFMMQKSVQVASADLSTQTHSDATAAPHVISLQDISPEALQFLNIQAAHPDEGKSTQGSGSGNNAPPPNDGKPAQPALGSGGSADNSGGSQINTAPANPVPSQLLGGPNTHVLNQTDYASLGGNGPLDFVNAIINTVASGHDIGQTLALSASVEQLVSADFGNKSAIKAVIFTMNATPHSDVVSLTPGFVWIDESLVSPSMNLTNPGGNITVNLSNGETITIVGVATIDHAVA